ncbi:hypothetical protein [Anthocerotibacter panamensis]|uniref:hypothetical protein n=1 Tax=Anthocerotibacter panamensis TaxID=2857077 RepID=UPI001FD8E305|nr:hypothetical protein [Anthocerotibacter panamensis]
MQEGGSQEEKNPSYGCFSPFPNIEGEAWASPRSYSGNYGVAQAVYCDNFLLLFYENYHIMVYKRPDKSSAYEPPIHARSSRISTPVHAPSEYTEQQFQLPAKSPNRAFNHAFLEQLAVRITYEDFPLSAPTEALLQNYGYTADQGHVIEGKDGFEMRLFVPIPRDSDHPPIASFRGTQPTSPQDLWNDAQPDGIGYQQFQDNRELIYHAIGVLSGHSYPHRAQSRRGTSAISRDRTEMAGYGCWGHHVCGSRH